MWFYSRTAFVNQINFKNATAFFTNVFNRKPALNKEYSFNLFALVLIVWCQSTCLWLGRYHSYYLLSINKIFSSCFDNKVTYSIVWCQSTCVWLGWYHSYYLLSINKISSSSFDNKVTYSIVFWNEPLYSIISI